MKSIKIAWACGMVLLALAAVATSAQAAKLVLRAGGKVVAPGSEAFGTLRFGACGSFKSSGKLTNNGAMVDGALFLSFENSPGGCGEAGPTVAGQLEQVQVSGNGLMTLTGKLTYTLTTPLKCEYTLTKLKGKFSIPGTTTSSEISGTAKRVTTGSVKGCKGALHVANEEGSLDDVETAAPFEAEL